MKIRLLMFIILFFFNISFSDNISNLEKGELLYKARNFREAINLLNLASAENAKDSKIFFIRGRCLLEIELYNQALNDFVTATNLLPQESTYMYYRGMCELKLMRFKASVADIEKSLEFDPKNFMCHYLLGVVYLELNANEKARQHFERAIIDGERFGFKISNSNDTKYYEEYNYLATNYDKESKKDNKNAKSFLLSGLLKKIIKDNYGAIQDFSSSLEINPTISINYYFRGVTQKEIKRFDKALHDIFKYNIANPKDMEAKALLQELKLLLNSDLVQDSDEGEIYLVTDVMPEFPGGQQNLYKFINNNLQYPKSALSAGLKGRVIVSFVVSNEGKVTNIQIDKGLSKECNNESLRILNKMPMWKPGMHNGKSVRVKYTLPILFSIKE